MKTRSSFSIDRVTVALNLRLSFIFCLPAEFQLSLNWIEEVFKLSRRRKTILRDDVTMYNRSAEEAL